MLKRIVIYGFVIVIFKFMIENQGYTIDFDTSSKKYPYNKYFNSEELAKLTKKYGNYRTIDRTSKSNPSKKHSKKMKKSLTSTKTMSSSRARAQSKQHNPLVSITA